MSTSNKLIIILWQSSEFVVAHNYYCICLSYSFPTDSVVTAISLNFDNNNIYIAKTL
jgi:hypothetical protein